MIPSSGKSPYGWRNYDYYDRYGYRPYGKYGYGRYGYGRRGYDSYGKRRYGSYRRYGYDKYQKYGFDSYQDYGRNDRYWPSRNLHGGRSYGDYVSSGLTGFAENSSSPTKSDITENNSSSGQTEKSTGLLHELTRILTHSTSSLIG